MTVRRLTALMGRVARRAVRLMVVLACVRVSVAVVGEWVTAAGLSAVILVRGLASWVVLEQRLDSARHPNASRFSSAPRGAGVVGHVAFARALVAVSERYLDLCEDQADEHGQTRGEAWR